MGFLQRFYRTGEWVTLVRIPGIPVVVVPHAAEMRRADVRRGDFAAMRRVMTLGLECIVKLCVKTNGSVGFSPRVNELG